MSNEYIRKIEDLKKEYKVSWNKMNKLRIAYKSSKESWADVWEGMEEAENKRENQIEKHKNEIKKEKELTKGILKRYNELEVQLRQMRPDKIDEKIAKLKEERKRLEAEIKKYS